MSSKDTDEAIREMLQGPWIVRDEDGDLEIVLEENDPEAVGYCLIATCEQESAELAELIAAAPNLLKSVDNLLSIVVDAIMHGMPITKKVADARNEAVTLLGLFAEAPNDL